jgi:hypothetical protein
MGSILPLLQKISLFRTKGTRAKGNHGIGTSSRNHRFLFGVQRDTK